MWIYLVLFGVLVIMVIAMLCVGNREGYLTSSRLTETTTIATAHPTVVGGTVSTKLVFDHSGRSTIVRKLLGDSGKTIILLHNDPFDMEVWSPLFMYVQHLKNIGKKIPNLICYDLLGHGTAWVPVPDQYNDANMQNIAWNFEEFSKDLYEVYQKYVGLGKVTLVGYGFGGTIVQYFALDNYDLIDHLYVIATTIGPTITGVPDEKNYLVNWIAKNPLVTYLTLEQKFVNWGMCMWFDNNDPRVCSNPKDETNSYGTVEYLLANKMYTEASCDTYLQVAKMLGTFDLRPKWKQIKVTCPVTFLIGNRDNYTNLKTIKKDMKIVRQSAPSVNLYMVNGKHGFALVFPKFIYQLISGQDMSKDPLTLEVA